MSRTFAAISTAPLTAALGIVRVSGPEAVAVASRCFFPADGSALSDCASHTVHYGVLRDADGRLIDRAMATVLRAPRTFTGEDTVEFSCHGGLVILRETLAALLEAGASAAEPGEFTKTAYLNGKLDLAESESIIDLITAPGRLAAEAALTASGGGLSARIAQSRQKLVELLAHILAYVDYTDEGIVRLEEEELASSLRSVREELAALIATYPLGRAAREGVRTVLCGRPNAGKSSVMNLLAGYERSIVTDIEGTTRDVVTDTVEVAGIPLLLSDTAGLRRPGDRVEELGVARAREEIAAAELALCVFDAARPLCGEDRELIAAAKGRPAVAILNKSDLPPVLDKGDLADFAHVVTLSAKTGEGLADLTAAIQELVAGGVAPDGAVLVTNLRQLDCLKRARAALDRAVASLEEGAFSDLAEIDITDAVNALGELTGETASESVIADIFSRFCVGK